MENSTYKIIDNISGVYGHLLPNFFYQQLSSETLATCNQCILLTDDKTNSAEVQGNIHEYCIFHPDVKCCTYEPDLPNFLVGAILSSKSSKLVEGRKRILQKIKQGEGVTPHYIQATKSSTQEYTQLIDQGAGCYMDLGCPYFDKSSKSCSIWLFRQANCSTFFCKSIEGIAGQQFWEAMNYYLTGVERELASFAAKTIEESYEVGLWIRDKAEYYIAAYTTIQKLKSDDFQKISTASLDSMLEKVKERYADATTTIVPTTLIKNPCLQYKELPDSRYQYNTGHGRCTLSKRLHLILPYFDGGAENSKVVDEIARERDIQVPPNMLLRLYKNRILVPSPDNA